LVDVTKIAETARTVSAGRGVGGARLTAEGVGVEVLVGVTAQTSELVGFGVPWALSAGVIEDKRTKTAGTTTTTRNKAIGTDTINGEEVCSKDRLQWENLLVVVVKPESCRVWLECLEWLFFQLTEVAV
jgi:hypothetical protein